MEFKKKAEITTSDFWYDLTDGGYIDPAKVLKNEEDIKKVKEAIQTLREFRDAAEKQDVLNYI